jgi:hypothetical protein
LRLQGSLPGLFLEDYGLTALISILAGAAIFWAAHRFVEHNKPTVYKRRIGWGVRCGARMYWLTITGRLEPELRKAGVA